MQTTVRQVESDEKMMTGLSTVPNCEWTVFSISCHWFISKALPVRYAWKFMPELPCSLAVLEGSEVV